jgi:transposase
MRNYTDKKVFLGIDVHKKHYSVTAICEGQVVKKDTIPAQPERLVGYFQKYFPGAQIESAYEAGFSGFFLHRFLEKHGAKNHVIHAAGMEIAVGDKVKTDKRDSLKLAVQLSVGRLQGIFVPSKEREDFRAVTRLRESFLRHRIRFGCQLKALLFQQGMIPFDHTQKVSAKWIKSILSEEMTPDIRYAVEQYANLWLHMTSKMKEVDEQLKGQAKQDDRLEAIYQSAPGVGPVAARILANELDDMSQFSNERKLFSYVGVTPSEYSSGEHVRQGHITRQGKAILRKVLVQAAWMAIRHDYSLLQAYERISKTSGGKKAIVAIARRLIGRIRSCFRTGQPYKTLKIPDEMVDTIIMKLNTETGEIKSEVLE